MGRWMPEMDELLEAALLPWPEVGELLSAGAIPILPFGALEQHGPHLPLSSDTQMADGLARRLAAAIGGLLLLAVPSGQTTDNIGFPGTVALSFGDPRPANAELGERILAVLTASAVELVTAFLHSLD